MLITAKGMEIKWLLIIFYLQNFIARVCPSRMPTNHGLWEAVGCDLTRKARGPKAHVHR